MALIWPWEYTETYGSSYKLWVYGPVTYRSLAKALTNTCEYATLVNEVWVHSLAFECVPSGLYAAWNCLDGWVRTLSEARKAWPAGMHGLKPPFLDCLTIERHTV